MGLLDGKYLVIGLSGPLPALIGNVKHIKGTHGYNRWFGIRWGHFDIAEYAKGYTFTYRDHPIVDTVKHEAQGKLMGKFFKCGKFIGKFKMEKIT